MSKVAPRPFWEPSPLPIAKYNRSLDMVAMVEEIKSLRMRLAFFIRKERTTQEWLQTLTTSDRIRLRVLARTKSVRRLSLLAMGLQNSASTTQPTQEPETGEQVESECQE